MKMNVPLTDSKELTNNKLEIWKGQFTNGMRVETIETYDSQGSSQGYPKRELQEVIWTV